MLYLEMYTYKYICLYKVKCTHNYLSVLSREIIVFTLILPYLTYLYCFLEL